MREVVGVRVCVSVGMCVFVFAGVVVGGGEERRKEVNRRRDGQGGQGNMIFFFFSSGPTTPTATHIPGQGRFDLAFPTHGDAAMCIHSVE